MIKVYKVKIGEKVYEVEVESVKEIDGTISVPKQEIKTETIISENSLTKIESPMQGLVVSLDVKMGDKIKKGDTLLVLEAMKMENPIVSPVDGVIKSIYVKKGDTIDGGVVVITIG
ncbi:MAG: biotin/lipoyl-containing protein [Cetobacterium sp.]